MAEARNIMIWYRDWIFYVLTITVIIFDQITKYVVRETIPLYDTLIEVGIFSLVPVSYTHLTLPTNREV